MSEAITQDYIADVIAKDQRFAAVADAIALENDLRESSAIKALLSAVRRDADQAFREVGSANPSDTMAVSVLIVRIQTLFYIQHVLDAVLKRGAVAESAIRADDEARAREEER
jgi:hypothetical protein